MKLIVCNIFFGFFILINNKLGILLIPKLGILLIPNFNLSEKIGQAVTK